jgi:hypothetical protein
MNTHVVPKAIGIAACFCSPTMMSAASAAPALVPTLIRMELGPLDSPSVLTISVEKCVALVEARDLAGAAPACDQAVSAARRGRVQPLSVVFAARAADEDLAIAYNDRAVLHYLSGRLELAVADIRRASRASRIPAVGLTAAAIEAAVGPVANTEAQHTAALGRNVVPD